jgi:hypothetical protein
MPDISVNLPSEIRPGEWWQWGAYESWADAIQELWEAGIPVGADGKLQIVNILPCMYCDGKEHGTEECPDA